MVVSVDSGGTSSIANQQDYGSLWTFVDFGGNLPGEIDRDEVTIRVWIHRRVD